MNPFDEQTEAPFEPLPTDWEEHAASLAASFAAPRPLAPGEGDLLGRFSHLCLRFGHAERAIQGEILFELPAHLEVIRGEGSEASLNRVERLAADERENLSLPEGPIEDLAELLDERGIKTIEWHAPRLARAGAFLFEPETGPAILSLAPLNDPAGRFLLAHAYGHLLMDVDPYMNRFCPHGDPASPPPEEIGLAEARAERFARALLVPADHFPETLALFGIRPEQGPSLERLADVATYYGVEQEVVLRRLDDLEMVAPARVAELLASRAAPTGPGAETDPPAASRDVGPASPGDPEEGRAGNGGREAHVDLPVRFVNLCLAMFLKRMASSEQVSTLLGVPPVQVEALLAWAKEQHRRERAPSGEASRGPEARSPKVDPEEPHPRRGR